MQMEFRKYRNGMLVGVAALLCAAAAGLWLAMPERPFPHPLETAMFVWNMQWTDPVRAAVRRAAPETDSFMVLIGELNVKDGQLAHMSAQPDWQVLAETRVPVTIVLRAGAGLSAVLTDAALPKTKEYIKGIVNAARAAAREKGVAVTGLQLDFDSPTSKLPVYRALLEALETEMAGLPLSITVLPTWLKTWEFGRVVKGLAYYVLQVHSLETPTSVDDPIVLCNIDKIPGYLRKASRLGVPFYLALPTYGYRVAFDEQGKFKALSAEGPAPGWPQGYRVRTVMADEAAMAELVRSLQQASPRNCRGVAWFRLPVDSDDLNWPWPELQAVMHGRAPAISFAPEVRRPEHNLYEVWIKNTGEANVLQQVALDIDWPGRALLAYDVLSGYQGLRNPESGALHLQGPAPRMGESAPAAWFRFAPIENDSVESIRLNKVEILKSAE